MATYSFPSESIALVITASIHVTIDTADVNILHRFFHTRRMAAGYAEADQQFDIAQRANSQRIFRNLLQCQGANLQQTMATSYFDCDPPCHSNAPFVLVTSSTTSQIFCDINKGEKSPLHIRLFEIHNLHLQIMSHLRWHIKIFLNN